MTCLPTFGTLSLLLGCLVLPCYRGICLVLLLLDMSCLVEISRGLRGEMSGKDWEKGVEEEKRKRKKGRKGRREEGKKEKREEGM